MFSRLKSSSKGDLCIVGFNALQTLKHCSSSEELERRMLDRMSEHHISGI